MPFYNKKQAEPKMNPAERRKWRKHLELRRLNENCFLSAQNSS